MSGWLLAAMGYWLLGALSAWRFPRLGPWGAMMGSLVAMVPALVGLLGGESWALTAPWTGPMGPLQLGLDPLSAFFLLLIGGLGAVITPYARSYFGHPPYAERAPGLWAGYNLLLLAMALVVSSRDGWTFLVAWEGMALASYFLVVADDTQASAREAGWLYLVASHVGTACLMAMFLLLGAGQADLGFQHLHASGPLATGVAVLGLIGFGTKAGFMPLHTWLPEAHPAAPSPVSALMSGVMLNMGIYGILCLGGWLQPLPTWWGWALMAVGAISGLLGVLLAVAQQDLKRMLAYSSIENLGLVALGLGLGHVGRLLHQDALAWLGFAGAMWHLANHAVFKSLLFLSAGAIAHATGTRDLDLLGGLLRRMPVTGTTFLVGAVAIAGLPPLNGFVGEFMLYRAAWLGLGGPVPLLLASVLALTTLTLLGGLAILAFTRAAGIMLLGAPRHALGLAPHDPPRAMQLPMILLALLCGGLAVLPAIPGTQAVMHRILAARLPDVRMPPVAPGIVQPVVLAALALLALVAVLLGLRARALARHRPRTGLTWDCGYAAPDARMQYTATAYAQPVTHLFSGILQPERQHEDSPAVYPPLLAFRLHTPDPWTRRVIRPAVTLLTRLMDQFRWIQRGNAQLYVLYVAVTLLVLLVGVLR